MVGGISALSMLNETKVCESDSCASLVRWVSVNFLYTGVKKIYTSQVTPLQRQAVTGFYLVHHEGVLDGAEGVYEEVIVILHIPSRFETAEPFEYRNRAAALFDSSITIIAVLVTESSGLPEAD